MSDESQQIEPDDDEQPTEDPKPDQEIEDLKPDDEQVSQIKGGPGGNPWNQ
jgi:hypothetical protein